MILKALAKEPADRYQSAQEMSDALAATLPEIDATSEAQDNAQRARRVWGRATLYLLAAFVLAFLVLAIQRLVP